MYNISKFKNCESPKIWYSYPVEEILDTIKYGDKHLPIIQKARTYAKVDDEYDEIKKLELPTHRFNFQFNGYASNANIVDSTGLIYLDADNVEDIPENDFIYAKWKSLSTTGYGILIKTHNVTQDNFSDTYNHIGYLLDIDLDNNARKATQQTILSYDPDLYFNPNSTIYSAVTTTNNNIVTNSDISNFNDITIETKKVSNHSIKKRKECIGRNDTFCIHSSHIRFNNINDYFINSDDIYEVRENSVMICDPFIPMRVPKGKRNSTMFFILSQYQLLNPLQGFNFLKSISNTINDRCVVPLNDNEVHRIINSVIKMHSENKLVMHYNSKRKILFNPKYKLTREEKMVIVNREMGKLRVKKSQQKIYNAIENWDFSLFKKITQKNVVECSGVSIATVKRHWSVFKDYVKEFNDINKQKG
ncbi:hypothetical protein A8C32_17750 [Flavivirga aquatica]|uniref:Uncharacterized protein n=1 Tax=Flavivirga aquatica TaxID=1849968 RepID=A0A1E5T7D0_9FLAO|nr:BT4734/BF3469 family protein [Flavivirga aquatica]OEK07283.1 hypothetical protein A8C32_17750 [Flavivirga aquatica]